MFPFPMFVCCYIGETDMFSAESTWGHLNKCGLQYKHYEVSVMMHLNDHIVGEDMTKRSMGDYNAPDGYSLRRNGHSRLFINSEKWTTSGRLVTAAA